MSILKQLESIDVLILGDVMIDRYLSGAVNRISPEAPVPVVLKTGQEDRLGGAANVALNVQALGRRAFLCSYIGADREGEDFLQLAQAHGIPRLGLLISEGRKTTVKTRILSQNQQMLRIDSEDTQDIDPEEEERLIAKVLSILDHEKIKVMILQDYNKGILTPHVIRRIFFEAKKRGVFIAVDPKKANFFAYKGADLFKPNLKEVRESVPFPVSTELESLQKATDYLREALNNHYTMLTLSEKGLFLDNGSAGKRYPTQPRSIADVSGAGDTVISIAAMALYAGFELDVVAQLSNLAGGQVCEFAGVVPVDKALLERELDAANG